MENLTLEEANERIKELEDEVCMIMSAVTDAYNDGYDVGYHRGYEKGYDDGYDEGCLYGP